jgi:hypothetical protein
VRQLLIAGSRGFQPVYKNADLITGMRQYEMQYLLSDARECLDGTFDAIIHGGARGVDNMAGRWGVSIDLPVRVYPADWELFGKRAGYIRNSLMVEDADAAIIIWDGESKGTKHTIDLMTASGKPYVLVVRPL